MSRQLNVLAVIALVAIAVPLVPFLIWGTRLDLLVTDWLDPPPPRSSSRPWRSACSPPTSCCRCLRAW